MRNRILQVLVIVLIFCIVSVIAFMDSYKPKEMQASKQTVVVIRPIIHVVVIESENTSEEVFKVDEHELELLAHLIYAEAGSDWCSDLMQSYVGSVALNRVASEYYPNTLHEVIYQDGQYSCVNNGMIYYNYNDRAYNCAKTLLEEGSVLPSNVVYQAPFLQGDGLYKQEQNMYFCYKGENNVTD